jgi:hypothetical protein
MACNIMRNERFTIINLKRVLLAVTFFFYLPFNSAQSLITFEDQPWSSDQSLDTNFSVNDFVFSSNKNFYTNYGYNFDVYGISIYYVFQEQTDYISITRTGNDLWNLASFAAYQVSESSRDTLVIEGWNNGEIIYTRGFAELNSWQVLDLNFEEINKVIVKIKSNGGSNINDFNFDNILIKDAALPVELISFSALVGGNSVELNWQTATELNNYGFEIERTPLSPPFTNNIGTGDKGGKQEGWQNTGFVSGNGTSNSPKNYSFTDNSVENSCKYRYRLKQIDNNGNYNYSKEIEVSIDLPKSWSLSQNFPNPFNPSTVISYQVAVGSKVTLKIYDVIGNEITTLVNEYKNAGRYEAVFTGESLTSGIYIYKLITDNYISVKKMILVK